MVIFSLIPLLFWEKPLVTSMAEKASQFFFFPAKWNFCPHLAPDECSCPTSVLFLRLGQASQSHAAA